MDSNQLKEKLRGMCRISKDGHWFPSSDIVRLPAPIGSVTTRRAVYAAFVGPAKEGFEVAADCGTVQCVAPEHAKHAACKYRARALNVSALWSKVPVMAAGSAAVKSVSAAAAPRSVSIDREFITSVSELREKGLGLSEIALALNSTIAKVVVALNAD